MLNREQLEVLVRLAHLPEFQAFRDYLADQREKVRDRCEGLTGENLYRAQGAAQWIKQLQEEMKGAANALQKMHE